MLTALAIANYRSIRHMVLPLGRLNVVTGANGSGKSNLYKALRLLSDAARGASTIIFAWTRTRPPGSRSSRRVHLYWRPMATIWLPLLRRFELDKSLGESVIRAQGCWTSRSGSGRSDR